MPTLKQLERARDAALDVDQTARSMVETEVREAEFKAAQAVRTKHKDRLEATNKARREARLAYEAAFDAAASHKWEGKKVQRTVEVGERWKKRDEVQFGVVEVRRHGTEFPQGQSLGLPSLGEAFVRLLKKDGTPSLRFAALYRYRHFETPSKVLDWALVK